MQKSLKIIETTKMKFALYYDNVCIYVFMRVSVYL